MFSTMFQLGLAHDWLSPLPCSSASQRSHGIRPHRMPFCAFSPLQAVGHCWTTLGRRPGLLYERKSPEFTEKPISYTTGNGTYETMQKDFAT